VEARRPRKTSDADTFIAALEALSLNANPKHITEILSVAGSFLQAGDAAIARGEWTAAIQQYSAFIGETRNSLRSYATS
jgi:hypothetical protein